ncbi:MAG: hypothetical protein XXXJIFNMEKO3_01626 [Candidatus Erwinia impunctatus]|nr:hypothetical protein XXXJIFNMEKO_01626 [Culicoides impunctatus]
MLRIICIQLPDFIGNVIFHCGFLNVQNIGYLVIVFPDANEKYYSFLLCGQLKVRQVFA